MAGKPRCVPALFDAVAQAHGERVAIIEHEGSHAGKRWTHAEFRDAIRAAGGALLASGLKAGERVAMLGNASARFLVADYGVPSTRLVRVPLDPSLSLDEHTAQLKDAGALAIVHEPRNAQRADELAARLGITRLFSTEEGDTHPALDLTGTHAALCPAADTIDPESIASLNYTGGTTGEPKAVMVPHRAFASAALAIGAGQPVHPTDIFLNLRPLWPIAGVVVTAHLAGGAAIVLGGRYEPRKFLQLCEQYRATVSSLVPTTLLRLLDQEDPRAFDLTALRAINMGGSATPPDVFERAIAAFGPKIGVLYGLTEGPWTNYLRPEWVAEAATPELRARRMRSAGVPLPGNAVTIRAPDDSELPAGEVGEITIRGGHVMLGYWNKPEASAQALRGGWLHSGDLGFVDADGWLNVTGRLKEVIRSGAKSVLPGEVEDALRSHPAVDECAVVGLPDREWGEVVTAAVVLRAGAAPVDETALVAQLIEHCAERLSSFKKPRQVAFFDELPKSHYGKVLRGQLRTLLMERALHASNGIQANQGAQNGPKIA